MFRARLSPHRQDCVDFGRTLARSSPAAEKEELLRAVGAVEREVYGEKAVDRMMIRTENDPRTTWDTLRATRTTWTRRD